MSRRQKLPRGRRSGISAVVALVIVAVCVLGAVTAIQLHLGHDTTALGRVRTVSDWLHTRRWSDTVVLTAGIVVAALGLLLLLAGLLPARRSMLRLADPDESTIFGIARASLSRDLGAVAASVDGVSGAKATLRRRRVTVSARSTLRDRTGLAEAVTAAVTTRVDELAPAKPLRVRARISGKQA